MPHALTLAPADRRPFQWACVAALALTLALTLTLTSGVQAQQGNASKPAPGAFERVKEASTAAPAVLSSPLQAGTAMPSVTAMPSGSGAGYHSPDSPIAPLPQRSDVVPWSVLSDLTKKTNKTAILPVFNDAQKAMDKTVQRIQGFMMPLDAKATQTHFLLTSVPLTCSFCIPGGPESMVEVKAKTPVRYSLEPVVVEGKFTVLTNDQYGLFYRIVDAVPVK